MNWLVDVIDETGETVALATILTITEARPVVGVHWGVPLAKPRVALSATSPRRITGCGLSAAIAHAKQLSFGPNQR